jgi:predicted MFS family arabinose efflux permease
MATDTGADAAPPSTPRRTGYRAPLAVAEFRAVFAAHVLSLLGNVVAQLALSVLVFRDTGSPLFSALTFALGLLPYALGGAVLAPLADRYPAWRVLVSCDLLCGGCVLLMVLPGTPVAVLLALRSVTAFVAPLFGGVRAASLGQLLDGESYVLGRSLIRVSAQAAQIGGFAAGGLLLALVPARSALLVTAVGFLASALILRLGTAARPTVTADRAAGGLRAVLGDRRVRALLVLCWTPPAFVVVPEALAAPFARETGAGPYAVGLLLAAMPVGAVAGELAVGALLGASARARGALPLAVGMLLPLVCFAPGPALFPALLLLAAAGTGLAYTLALDRWYADAVPEALHGRAMTVMSAGLMTVQGLGMTLGGLGAELAPPHLVITGTGVLGVVCTLAAVVAVRRSGVAGAARAPRSRAEE